MNCWKSHAPLDQKERKISFRAICDRCGISLHCCKNCQNYAPGRANDCLIPGTDHISDREANNFCEEFELLTQPTSPSPINFRKSFDDLFK